MKRVNLDSFFKKITFFLNQKKLPGKKNIRPPLSLKTHFFL